MSKKNKLVEMIEHEFRWYYRIPTLVAITGVIFAIISLFNNDSVILNIGGCLFFVGLGAQWVLGFHHFGWKLKRK